MEEIIYQKSYQEYKAELDAELQKTAEGFVRIGYLLKVARDTNILAESQYKTVTEFAEAEYGLNATYVSRFISINDRFSKDGYSAELDDQYKGFGYAKLTVMLQLPDSMNEELNPEMSKSDIEAIKSEFDAEQKVSDIERLIEGSNPAESNLDNLDERMTLLYQTILALGEAEPELYIQIAAVDSDDLIDRIPMIMVPSDTKVYSIRVIGKGRMMLTCAEDKISIVNTRTAEKEVYDWSYIAAAWSYAGVENPNKTPIEKWEARYEKNWPIAPVQNIEQSVQEAPKKETKRKESKVTKAKPDNAAEHIEEPQLEGQMSIEGYPEVMPEATENDCHEQEQSETIAETETVTESVSKEPTGEQSDFPIEVKRARDEVIELLAGIKSEICKPAITSREIRELKDNTGCLVLTALSKLAEELWNYEIAQDDEEDEDE